MKRHIHILHTNDIHSYLHRTPQIASIIRSLRRKATQNGDAVVTVDVGDHMDRMRVETEGTDGQVNVAIMNETGYDFVTLGNNEGLTFPHDVLDHMYEHASFQVLLSNWLNLNTKERPHWMLPYAIREWFGCKVAFIAVTAPFNDFYRLLGWEVLDPFDATRRLVAKLCEEQGVDAIVVLSHLGFPHDERLATSVPGITLILGGHTHHLLKEVVRRGDTWIAATGKFGDFVGEVKLTVDTLTGAVVAVSGGCHTVSDVEPDPRVQHLLKDYSRQAERKLREPVIELKTELPVNWEGESPFANLLADSLLEEVVADAALVNSGQLLEGLPPGLVTLRDLHRICPSPINPCRMRLNGAQLRRALEESLLEQFQEMPIKGFGFRGEQLGSLAISGMYIKYRTDAPPYEKIIEARIGGELLRDDKRYSIATIDMFTFGIGYCSLQAGADVEFFLPEFLRDLLAKRLRKKDHIAKTFHNRWHRV